MIRNVQVLVVVGLLALSIACGGGAEAVDGDGGASPDSATDPSRPDARQRPDAGPTNRVPNAELTDIPNNTWRRIADRDAIDAFGIGDYSGMAIDTTNGSLLLFGGGHAAPYAGNAVWRFSLETLEWESLYESDPESATLDCGSLDSDFPGAVFYPEGESIATAMPTSRHTYDTVEWMPNIQRMVQGNGWTHTVLWTCGGGNAQGNPSDMWHFNPLADFSQETGWTYMNNSPDVGSADCAAYADSDGQLYWLGTPSKGTSQTVFYRYDGENDQWSPLPAPPIGVSSCAMTYVGSRNSIVVMGREFPEASDLWEYDLDGGSWENLSPTGFVPPDTGRWGLAWDAWNDVLVALRGFEGENYTLVYDFGTNSFTRMTPSGDAPAQLFDLSGRVKYDPLNNVVLAVVHVNYSYETWAYKYQQ